MATIPNPVTTALVENTIQHVPQKKVTLGPANVVAYMFQGTGVFMCLGMSKKWIGDFFRTLGPWILNRSNLPP